MQTASEIIQKICTIENISNVEFFSTSRKRQITDARCLAAAVLHFELKLHPVEIGLYFNQHRTTILHLINNVKNIPELNKKFLMIVNSESIRNEIILLSIDYMTGDKTVKVELQNKIIELAKWYNVPIKPNQQKGGVFKVLFKEFIKNDTGYIAILQRFYNSVV